MEAVHTLIGALGYVAGRGGSFHLHHETGSTVSLVRNAISAAFLESGAERLLMLDSDQAIGGKALARMIDLDQPVVGCVYPRRASFNWSKVKLDRVSNMEEAIYQASEYVGRLIVDESGHFPVENGFARAEHVGTGVLLIKREAFEQLMRHFPDLKGRGFGLDAYPKHGNSERWGFFNPMNNEEGIPLSEDISFCRRWRQSGGEIWADVQSTVMHVGRYAHAGNYLDYLKATGN